MPCSLCGETGHNKVTCGGPSSADKQETRRVNAYRKWKEDWREDFYAAEEIDDRDQLFAAGRYMVSQPPATRYAVAEEQFTQELTHDITASNFAEHCDRNIQYSVRVSAFPCVFTAFHCLSSCLSLPFLVFSLLFTAFQAAFPGVSTRAPRAPTSNELHRPQHADATRVVCVVCLQPAWSGGGGRLGGPP